jgi:hypothetical protein
MPAPTSPLTVEELRSPGYWRRICPHLHVCDAELQACILGVRSSGGGGGDGGGDDGCCSSADARAVRRRLISEGYAHLSPAALSWSTDVAALAEGVRCLARHGWPATALAVYDEAWVLGRDAAAIMLQATGNTPVMDSLGFYVDPSSGYRGFSPHRDRQPEDWVARGHTEDPRSTFREDGTAK